MPRAGCGVPVQLASATMTVTTANVKVACTSHRVHVAFVLMAAADALKPTVSLVDVSRVHPADRFRRSLSPPSTLRA
jgi:hypothetical protein